MDEIEPVELTEKEANDRQSETVEQRYARVEMIPVESSNIAAVGYLAARISGISWLFRDLFVSFNSGSTYCYFDCPEQVHAALMLAPSKGKFFHQNIRNMYSYQKMSG